LGRKMPEEEPKVEEKKQEPKYDDVVLGEPEYEPSQSNREKSKGVEIKEFELPSQDAEGLAAMLEARNADKRAEREIQEQLDREPEVKKPKGFSISD